nr:MULTISPECIES: sulfatase [Myxococcaceae]
MPLPRAALLGCRAGLCALLALYTACAVFNMRLGYQGNESALLNALVWNEWRSVVLWQVGRLLLAYSLVGLVSGALFGLAVGLRWPRRGAVLWAGALGPLLLDALLVAADMAQHPHLYAATLYGRGGAWAALLRGLSGTNPWLFRAPALLLVLAPLVALAGAALRRLRVAPRPGVAAVSGALALGALLFGVHGAAQLRTAQATRAPERPNLLILASDGLRPDHLSGNGYARPTSPNLDALMAHGTRFSDAVVQLPRTAPSWATLLTSRWAGAQPVRHTLVDAAAREARLPTLATALSAAGYRTVALSDYAGDLFSRFAFGFDEVQAPGFDFPGLIRQRMLITHVALLPFTALVPSLFPEREQFPELTDPSPLRARALDALGRLDARGEPFALLLFASTTHFPYAAPWPEEGRFVPEGYRGPWRFGATPQMEVDPQRAPAGPEDVAALVGNYDAGVAAFDALAGDVLAALERRGLAGRTLVVLLSDHGEHLMEVPGRGQGHGEHLWGAESLRIPLALRLPGRVTEGRTVAQRVRSLDVAPTLLALLGVGAPASFQGRSLAPLVAPGAVQALPDAPALLETDVWFSDRDGEPYQRLRLPYPWVYETARVEPPRGDIALKPAWEETVERAKHRGLYWGRWKLLELPTPAGLQLQLYDVQADPEERVDVAGAHPEVVAQLRALLARERVRAQPSAP